MSENVTRFLIDLSKDPAGMEAFSRDPDRLLAGAGLTAEERALLATGDADAICARLGMLMSPPTSSQGNLPSPPPPKPKPSKAPATPRPPKPAPPAKPEPPRRKSEEAGAASA